MPLTLSGDRILTRWAEKKSWHPAASVGGHDTRVECVKLALINNMPDPALEDTEMQFFELLDAAAGDIPVHIKLYSLPELTRGDRGQQRLSNFYFSLDELWTSRIDAVIITGTEPHRPDLRDEPYWHTLVDLLDWAEDNTVSTVLSCLAAHASVLHSDGITRHRLADKQFGIFDYTKTSDHQLTNWTANPIRIPHSRWNEVREDALTSCGYDVLTKSAETSVDLFVKQKRKSLFVYFQGHPEYDAETLLKEYRRDIKRFLRRERESYPSMPKGYFDTEATRLLTVFGARAQSDPQEELLATFPDSLVVHGLQKPWHSAAMCVYRNWLQYVASKRVDTLAFAPMACVGRG